MNQRALSWRWLAAIFALALVLRVVCVAQYEAGHPLADRPVIDEASYDRWAREIAGGEVLGREIFFQEPLYPYALGFVYAVSGDDPAAQRSVARYVQAVLGAATAVLCALLGMRLFGARAGIVAGLLFALHRPAIWFPALLLKENLFLPLVCVFALALATAASWRQWLAVGALAAAGALLRGNMFVLLPVFVAWPLALALRRRAEWRPALLAAASVVAGAALVLLPVAARNQVVGGRFVLTTSGAGTNFYGGNNADNPYGLATEFDWVRGIPEHEAGDWRHEASRRAGRELDATETSSFWLRETLASMRARPLDHAAILWRKLRLTLGSYEVPDNHFLEWDARYVAILRAPLPGFAFGGTLALAGAFAFAAWLLLKRADIREAREAQRVLLFAAVYLATIVLTVTSERVRLVLVPLLLPFAGFFVERLLVPPREWLVLLPSALLAALTVLVPALPSEMRARDFDERDYNLAVSLLAADDRAGAAPVIERLQREHSGSARVALLQAEFEYRRARAVLDRAPTRAPLPEDAAHDVESALRRLEAVSVRGNAQERFRADALAGAIHQYFGQWPEAERSYRSALAFDPEDRDLRRRLAVVIAEKAMQQPKGELRSAGLLESIALLERLVAVQADPELEQLLAKMNAELR